MIVWLNRSCRAKVDDLELIVARALLEQDVLGLQIPMHNLLIVAVVHHGQDLFHNDGCISFAHLARLHDLIEELATFANPITPTEIVKYKREVDLLHDDEEALVVFKELIHFDNVRMVLPSAITYIHKVTILSKKYK